MTQIEPMTKGAFNSPKQKAPVLSLEKVSKSYGPIIANDGITFDLYPGEVLAVVGDNGAGKSTLVKIISGVLKPTSGRILIDGIPTTFNSPAEAHGLGIETVFQNLALVEQLDVPGNFFLGRELLATNPIAKAFGFLRRKEMEAESRETLRKLNVQIASVGVLVSNLSGGQRQATAIARSVYWGRKVLLLDEPTAALGVKESRRVLELLSPLREAGIGILMISHNMQQVLETADRVMVLRQGKVAFLGDASNLTANSIVGYITGSVDRKEDDGED